jgi:voltage-gated potassium channel
MPDGPPERRRVGSRLDARLAHVVANRRIFPFLVVVTVSIGLLAGFVATLVDKENFPSLADGVWWAIVTLATVGYGDIVPTTPLGRIVGSVLIIFGVTFLTFLTAIVTSLFISTEEEAKRALERERRQASEAEVRELLLQLNERMAALEAKLGR